MAESTLKVCVTDGAILSVEIEFAEHKLNMPEKKRRSVSFFIGCVLKNEGKIKKFERYT